MESIGHHSFDIYYEAFTWNTEDGIEVYQLCHGDEAEDLYRQFCIDCLKRGLDFVCFVREVLYESS